MKQEARQALIFILINNRRDLKSGGSLAKAVAQVNRPSTQAMAKQFTYGVIMSDSQQEALSKGQK